MERRAHLVFKGRVQGVFFRANAQRIAKELGLRGWVRNCLDGSVEAVVEGPQPQVRSLIERLRREVNAARVDAVEENWEAATGEFAAFDVRPDS